MRRVPVIDVTDLYHPHQDVGDNVDLIAAYALPEIDLKGVILDCTDDYRRPFTQGDPSYHDPTGPREPGFIPVLQLNYIFNRNVPAGVGPFTRMKSPGDTMEDLPAFQETGLELIRRILEESEDPVHILSFGSARSIAVAFNRWPELLRAKVARIHLCAGASDPSFLEWNVNLDPQAICCLLRSGLPIALYPCATKDGPFAYGRHNTFWRLPHLDFIAGMDPKLQRYLWYAFARSNRDDFLGVLEDPSLPDPKMLEEWKRRPHNVWESAVWLEVSGRRLVRRADGRFRIVRQEEIADGDEMLPHALRPCAVEVGDDGRFRFELVEGNSSFSVYDREDPYLNERALREALPALYQEFSLED